jgi:hypothetical protein
VGRGDLTGHWHADREHRARRIPAGAGDRLRHSSPGAAGGVPLPGAGAAGRGAPGAGQPGPAAAADAALGPSGSGKSSLVQAWVLRALADGKSSHRVLRVFIYGPCKQSCTLVRGVDKCGAGGGYMKRSTPPFSGGAEAFLEPFMDFPEQPRQGSLARSSTRICR